MHLPHFVPHFVPPCLKDAAGEPAAKKRKVSAADGTAASVAVAAAGAGVPPNPYQSRAAPEGGFFSASELDFKPDIEKTLGYVFDAINVTRREIAGRVPLIGFAGAPWTLLAYMVEGKGGARTGWAQAKKALVQNPGECLAVLQAITDIVVDYLCGQALAGAQLLQVFDSNAGYLSQEDFDRFALPFLLQIPARVKRKLIASPAWREVSLNVPPMTCFARGAHHAVSKLTRGFPASGRLASCIRVTPKKKEKEGGEGGGGGEARGDGESFCIRFGYDTLSLDWTMDPLAARRDIEEAIKQEEEKEGESQQEKEKVPEEYASMCASVVEVAAKEAQPLCLQGNIDPMKFYGTAAEIDTGVGKMLKAFREGNGGSDGNRRHIANLGWGMRPDFTPEAAEAFLSAVKKHSA